MNHPEGLFWRVLTGEAPHVGVPALAVVMAAGYVWGVPLPLLVLLGGLGTLQVAGVLLTPCSLFFLASFGALWWSGLLSGRPMFPAM